MMNPAPMKPEFVPLQGKGDPEQHGEAQMVQSTTVNIISEPPQDHIIWSFLNFSYGNPCCLGLVAFIYSIKSRDRKVAGDLEAAQRYGSTAHHFNTVSSVLLAAGYLTLVIYIIAVVYPGRY